MSIVTPYAEYSFEDIRLHGSKLLQGSDSVFTSAFSLAQQWLSGAKTFTFHTSGSTGTPKEIILKRSQLEASAKGTIAALGLTSSEHILLCMNPAFIGGAMLLIRGLMLNATITLQEPSGNPLQNISADHSYTFASFTPMQLHALTNGDADALQKLNRFHHILLGGAAVSGPLEESLKTASTKVYHTYGMTETVSHIALKQIGKDEYFKALPGVELKTDERGCLAIKSGSTANEWVYTNDAVTLTDENSFEVLGRIDDVINTGGVKVWPLKIEEAMLHALQEIGLQHNLFVSWLPDDRLGQKIIAVLEGNPFDAEMKDKLTGLLEKKLNRYELPRTFYYFPAFILTNTEKVNKSETLKMINLRP
jgi:O-succinylbenzoic acid--CoA ligase